MTVTAQFVLTDSDGKEDYFEVDFQDEETAEAEWAGLKNTVNEKGQLYTDFIILEDEDALEFYFEHSKNLYK